LFHDRDLPQERALRDQVILAAFGSPDSRQIDGLGGADSLTSKTAIVGPPTTNADVDYTFGQVSITAPLVDYGSNCGNISSAVGPFAIDEGLVPASEPVTKVRIHNTNSRKIIVAEVPTQDGMPVCVGDYAISGVPGTGAKITLDFLDSGGAVTGRLLPTGQPRDVLDLGHLGKFEVSVVDAATAVVFVKAKDLGLTGTETPNRINADQALLALLEAIRGAAAVLVGKAREPEEAAKKSPSVPKIAFVGPPASYETASGETVQENSIDVVSRIMSMQKAHKAYAVTGAICTAAAASLEGTVVSEVLESFKGDEVRLGHAGGTLSVEISIEDVSGEMVLRRAALGRTARRIMEGYVYVPNRLFSQA
jgi:2-methylaconitate cis-trans-isomerase PrpF